MTRNYIICKMKFKLYRLAVLFVFMSYIYTEKCLVNNKDFSAIERFGPWEVISYDGNNTYQINLCGRVPTYSAGVGKPNCHNDTVVCMVQDGQAFSLANYTNNTINAPSNDQEAEMWIVRNGDGCPDLAGVNLNSIINLKCGKTLGFPKFLEHTYCTSYFEWRTSYACRNMPVSHHEVPCYVYNGKGQLIDLSALVKTQGGYLVDSAEGWEFYINVCRDITAGTGDKTSQCPPGSAACRVKNDTSIDMGHTDKKLQVDARGHPTLTYTSNVTVPGCTAKPKTTIQFVCPESGGVWINLMKCT